MDISETHLEKLRLCPGVRNKIRNPVMPLKVRLKVVKTPGCLGAAIQDSEEKASRATMVAGTGEHTASQRLISVLGAVFTFICKRHVTGNLVSGAEDPQPISGGFGGFNSINFKRPRAYW